MICIYMGCTQLLDPSQPLALSSKPVYKDAGMIQTAIHANMGDVCQHDRAIQYCKEGVFTYQLREELPNERYVRMIGPMMAKVLPFKRLPVDPFLDEPLLQFRHSPQVSAIPLEDCWTSEGVQDMLHDFVGLQHFPENFSFGNGVTVNSSVILGGKIVYLSWCVLTPTAAYQHKNDHGVGRALKECMEG